MHIRPKLISHLCGIPSSTWWRVLSENRFRIGLRYLPRAMMITGLSVLNSLVGRLDTAKHDCIPGDILFILGHWGSGTTWLHTLFSHDPRINCPTLFQVTNPKTYRLTPRIVTRLADRWMPPSRVWDSVPVSLDMPMEDEFALCALSGLSPYMGWAFPEREAYYDRYLTMHDVPLDEVRTWKSTLQRLAASYVHDHPGRLLVLKSPPHTARIHLLLELFPDARFVHLHRHPFDVFHSTRRLYQRAMPYFQLQHRRPGQADAGIVKRYREMHESYATYVNRISPGRYHEIRFQDLRTDPLRVMRAAYDALEMPSFCEVEPILKDHLSATAGYATSTNPPLDPVLKEQLITEWRPFFERWDYATNRSDSCLS